MSINRYTGSGNLAREPELRRTQSGTAVLNFCVAVNNRRKDQGGNWVDDPCFIECAVFGTRAEKLSGMLAKGMKLAVEGKLRQENWQAKDGSRRSKISLMVDEVEFMSRNQGGNPGSSQQQEYGGQYGGVYDQDEIPF